MSSWNAWSIEGVTESGHVSEYHLVFETGEITLLKALRRVFGFGIEFLENKEIEIFGHFMAINFITRYSNLNSMYFSYWT